MVAILFIHYNFARIHEALGVTPAMAAGLARLEAIVLLAN
jgi:transposase InsO family protein